LIDGRSRAIASASSTVSEVVPCAPMPIMIEIAASTLRSLLRASERSACTQKSENDMLSL